MLSGESSGNIAKKDQMSIRLLRRIIQGFSNIIRLVFLKRSTSILKFNKTIYITFFARLAFIIMRTVRLCGNRGRQLELNSFEDAF